MYFTLFGKGVMGNTDEMQWKDLLTTFCDITKVGLLLVIFSYSRKKNINLLKTINFLTRRILQPLTILTRLLWFKTFIRTLKWSFLNHDLAIGKIFSAECVQLDVYQHFIYWHPIRWSFICCWKESSYVHNGWEKITLCVLLNPQCHKD